MTESPAATRWGLVYLLLAAGVVCAFQVGKAPMALPIIRDELGLSLTATGWLLSMVNATGMLVGTAVGSLGDQFGHRRVILVSLAGLVLASLAGALADGATLLLVSRFVEGMGFIGVAASVPALLIRVSRTGDMRMVMGIWGGYFPIGVALMVLLSPAMLAMAGWRGLWVGNALVAALFAIVLATLTRPLSRSATPNRERAVLRGMWHTATSPGPVLLALSFGAYAGIFLTVMGFLPTLLEEQGVSPAMAALLTAVAVLLNVVGNLLGAWALHRGFARWVLMCGTFLVIGFCTTGIYAGMLDEWLRYAFVVMLSLAGGVIPGCCFVGAVVLAPTPNLVATTNGLLIQGSHLGQVLTPPATAAVVAGWGTWQAAPLVLVCLAGLGALLTLGIRVLERPRSAGVAQARLADRGDRL